MQSRRPSDLPPTTMRRRGAAEEEKLTSPKMKKKYASLDYSVSYELTQYMCVLSEKWKEEMDIWQTFICGDDDSAQRCEFIGS